MPKVSILQNSVPIVQIIILCPSFKESQLLSASWEVFLVAGNFSDLFNSIIYQKQNMKVS